MNDAPCTENAIRIVVLGTSGSGKSTFARRAASRLGVPLLELDAIRHQANWTSLPDDQFIAAITDFSAGPVWVIDGNYSIARKITIARATHVVWLDPSRPVVMAQVLWRSFQRAAFRQKLWNGNREHFHSWLRADHPIRWAWSTHAGRRERFTKEMAEHWVRLPTRRAASEWLEGLAANVNADPGATGRGTPRPV